MPVVLPRKELLHPESLVACATSLKEQPIVHGSASAAASQVLDRIETTGPAKSLVCIGLETTMKNVWKCQAVLLSQTGRMQHDYIDERMRELQDTGTAAEEFARNDPVGLLWHLGVLCIPQSFQVDQDAIDLLHLHDYAQQTYSVQILEEDGALEEPFRAAMALLSWIQARKEDGSSQTCKTTDELDILLNSAMAEKARATSPTVSDSSGTSSDPDLYTENKQQGG